MALGETGYAEWVGDVSDLTLLPAQLRLARAVEATGVPTVLVLLEGRPRIVREVVDGARGIVLANWPGMEGARARGVRRDGRGPNANVRGAGVIAAR